MRNKMTLGRVASQIPSNQCLVVKDYLTGAHYADGRTDTIIDKVLDYNHDLRESDVYGISLEGSSIVIHVLIAE